MFHVHLPVPAARSTAARDRIASEDRAWLAPNFGPTDLPGWSKLELYVGENLMRHDDARLVPLFAQAARAGAGARS